jgi:hypothetical protein
LGRFFLPLCNAFSDYPKKDLTLIGDIEKKKFPTVQNWGKIVSRIYLCENLAKFSSKLLVLKKLVKLCFLRFSKPKELPQF